MVIKAENKTKSSKQERKKQYNLNPDLYLVGKLSTQHNISKCFPLILI